MGVGVGGSATTTSVWGCENTPRHIPNSTRTKKKRHFFTESRGGIIFPGPLSLKKCFFFIVSSFFFYIS